MYRQHGWTLVELLAVVSIAAILAGTGIGEWGRAHARHQAGDAARELALAVRLARRTSAITHRNVTLCPSTDARHCSTNWASGLIAFTDLDADGQFEPPDRIIHRFSPTATGSRIAWRAFRSKPWLQMTPTGRTAHQNGSFVYCPRDGDPRLARVVIVNKQGRTRFGTDSDLDGIVEMANGKPVSCS